MILTGMNQTSSMEVFNQFLNIPFSPFEGTWISENGDERIDCKLREDVLLESTWPNQFVEFFQIDSQILQGVENPEIYGYPLNDDLIKWNTGNLWVREGIEL